MRTNPSVYGLAKITESAISQAVIAYADTVQLAEHLLVCEKNYNAWDGLKNAYEHRRSMIKYSIEFVLSGMRSSDDNFSQEKFDHVMNKKLLETTERVKTGT